MVHIYYLLALALLWDDNAGGSLNPPKQSWQKASTQAANSAHIQMQCMLGAAAGICAQHYWPAEGRLQSTHKQHIKQASVIIDRVIMHAWGNKLANNAIKSSLHDNVYSYTAWARPEIIFCTLSRTLLLFGRVCIQDPWPPALHACIYERAHPTLTTSLRACSSSWVTCMS